MTTINSADLLQIVTKIENIEREKIETSELLTDAYIDKIKKEIIKFKMGRSRDISRELTGVCQPIRGYIYRGYAW